MRVEAKGVVREFIRKRGDSNVFTAVEETSLTIEEGLLTVLTGHSGSGKSTLLNMLSGLLKPTRGRVLYGETDLYAMDDVHLSAFRNQQIGIIPQGQTALQSLTVFENVMLPYTLYRRGRGSEAEEMASRASELLKLTGIEGLHAEMPSELSGGELRRMAVARALLLRPPVLFADEPTADLDPENSRIVMDLLRRATREGMAVFLVTHEMEAARMADRSYRMDHGALSPMTGTRAVADR